MINGLIGEVDAPVADIIARVLRQNTVSMAKEAPRNKTTVAEVLSEFFLF